ncbi:hypothetical protein COOONC_04875 [Cooperia oncophora]
MIDVICLLLILMIIHLSIGCKSKGAAGDESEVQSTKSSQELPKESKEKPPPSLKLATCLDDDHLEVRPTQADDDDNPELGGKIWEEAGDIEVDAMGVTVVSKEPIKGKEKLKEIVVAKKKEAEEVKVEKPREKEEKKEEEKKKEEEESQPKAKKKEPEDMWDLFKELQETQPDLIEYSSIIAPVTFDMMAQKGGDLKAGSLGDLLSQVNKAKSARKEREKNNKTNNVKRVALERPKAEQMVAEPKPSESAKELLETPSAPTPVRLAISLNKAPSPKTSTTQKAKSEIVKGTSDKKSKKSAKVGKKGKETTKRLAVIKEKAEKKTAAKPAGSNKTKKKGKKKK